MHPPCQEGIADGIIACRHPRIGNNHPGEPIRILSHQAQADQAAPILADKCYSLQIHFIQPRLAAGQILKRCLGLQAQMQAVGV